MVGLSGSARFSSSEGGCTKREQHKRYRVVTCRTPQRDDFPKFQKEAYQCVDDVEVRHGARVVIVLEAQAVVQVAVAGS